MALDAALAEVLGCPACKHKLTYNREPECLTCRHCRLRFKVEDDIPILLMDEATKWDDE